MWQKRLLQLRQVSMVGKINKIKYFIYLTHIVTKEPFQASNLSNSNDPSVLGSIFYVSFVQQKRWRRGILKIEGQGKGYAFLHHSMNEIAWILGYAV